MAIAGCLADSSTDTESGRETDDEGLEYDVQRLEGGSDADWWDDDGPTGIIDRLESTTDETWMLDSEDATAWYEETDFERESLVYLESVGPNTCTDTLEVHDIQVEDDVLTGAATVIEEQPDDVDEEEMLACGQAITYSSAFVRIDREQLPAEIEIEITDGWGETETIETEGEPTETLETAFVRD